MVGRGKFARDGKEPFFRGPPAGILIHWAQWGQLLDMGWMCKGKDCMKQLSDFGGVAQQGGPMPKIAIFAFSFPYLAPCAVPLALSLFSLVPPPSEGALSFRSVFLIACFFIHGMGGWPVFFWVMLSSSHRATTAFVPLFRGKRRSLRTL